MILALTMLGKQSLIKQANSAELAGGWVWLGQVCGGVPLTTLITQFIYLYNYTRIEDALTTPYVTHQVGYSSQ